MKRIVHKVRKSTLTIEKKNRKCEQKKNRYPERYHVVQIMHEIKSKNNFVEL